MISPKKKKLIAIHHREDIPAFASEAEEHAFWSTHELGDELWDQAEPFAPEELPAPRPAARPVVIRLDDATLNRAKALARRRRIGYHRLIEELVTAHLSETDVVPDR